MDSSPERIKEKSKSFSLRIVSVDLAKQLFSLGITPNKSLTLIISAIASVVISNNLVEKVLLLASNVSFGEADIVFNLDISYYMVMIE